MLPEIGNGLLHFLRRFFSQLFVKKYTFLLSSVNSNVFKFFNDLSFSWHVICKDKKRAGKPFGKDFRERRLCFRPMLQKNGK